MIRKEFKTTAYKDLKDFRYGHALYPVTLKNGIVIGGGTVYPEINFTLPPMLIEEQTMSEVIHNYKEIIEGVCERARDLYSPGFVAEIETLPPMTFHPAWGEEVCKTVVDIIIDYGDKYGTKGAVRITPNDIREGRDLVHMWHGSHWDAVLETFDRCARTGAQLLAIESIGGKEVHDGAIMYCNIRHAFYALAELGCTDMERLWTAIVGIAEKNNVVASGDTACGFANTAMVLAERNYIPRVFAAVIRVMCVVRSLVAYECGAQGPHKDCGYEGVYIKAITGTPIATEGRVAACAHLSPVGNVAACLCDLWSNESVQNIKLLGGAAPTVSFEQLLFDCRLMNTASEAGQDTANLLRDLNADSDSPWDPQAYILRPDVVLDISKEIVKAGSRYERMKVAAALALDHIRKAYARKKLTLTEKDAEWIDILSTQIDKLPADIGELGAEVRNECEQFDSKKYDM
jgi:methanol--5-hydroxybenzimidazolylcobamide Co-methyltransferase